MINSSEQLMCTDNTMTISVTDLIISFFWNQQSETINPSFACSRN